MNKETENQIVDVVQKKRKRPDKTEYLTPHCEPGEISRMLSQAVTIANWPEIDTDDADQVIGRIREYHQYCIDNDIKPDMSGMALAIGVSRPTLWKWENGVESNKPQSVRNAIKKGREINENILVTMMQNGRINPIPALFLLKNNHSYVDQQEVVVTPNTPFQDMDARDAQKKIIDAIPVDTAETE